MITSLSWQHCYLNIIRDPALFDGALAFDREVRMALTLCILCKHTYVEENDIYNSVSLVL